MQIYPEQLTKHLFKSSHFVIQGEEPFQKLEALDTIVSHFKNTGVKEHVVFNIESNFDYQKLFSELNNYSLFCEKKIIQLNFEKISKEGQEILKKNYSTNSKNIIILNTTNNLTKTTWFKSIANDFITVSTYYPKEEQYLTWVQRKCQKHNLAITPKSISLIAEKTEGNLLIADQIIRQISFLVGANLQDLAVSELLCEYTQFNIFDLVDAALKRDKIRTFKIFDSILNQNVELTTILWSIGKEAKLLLELHQSSDKASIFKKHNVWPKKQKVITQSLQEISEEDILDILQTQPKVDAAIKSSNKKIAIHLLQNMLLILLGSKRDCSIFYLNNSEAIL